MKNLIFVLLLIPALFSCSKDETDFKADPLATVLIKPAILESNTLRSGTSDSTHLSALDIVKKTTALQYYYIDSVLNQGVVKAERGFDKLQRDTISSTPCLKMWATDIILEDGKLEYAFIESKDCILLNFDLKISGAKRDTIAYIPNAVLRAAETQIKALYAEKDYEAIYELFNDAYTFIPISGAEYKALKAKNLQ